MARDLANGIRPNAAYGQWLVTAKPSKIRIASSHPSGVVKDFAPTFAASPIGTAFPDFGSTQNTLTLAAAVLFIVTEKVARSAK